MQSLPWHCGVCGRRFHTAGGGLCRRCRQPACRSCLHRVATSAPPAGSPESPWVCMRCLTVEEQGNLSLRSRMVRRWRGER